MLAISTNRSAPGPDCSSSSSGNSGSGSSSSMVRVQGATAPAHRLLLILLLLVALHVRAAWVAPWRAQGADEGGGNGYPASRLVVGLEPLGHPGGPPRAKYQAEGGRKSPAPSEVVRQMLEELKRAHETDREAVQKEALPEGSGGSLPVSAEEREAMRAAGTPVLPRPREDHHSRVYGFPRADSGTEQSCWAP
ncbi:uncharacterized protein LJ206_014482 [Theristicus caerulescens]